MHKGLAVKIIVCVLSLISANTLARGSSNCTDCIIVDQKNGDDNLCLKNNITPTTPCETIGYALSIASLNNTDVVLQGDYLLNQTLIVSHVSGLTIQSDGSASSTIYCSLPTAHNDTGSGLVFESVLNLTISHLTIKGCGTLQLPQYSASYR